MLENKAGVKDKYTISRNVLSRNIVHLTNAVRTQINAANIRHSNRFTAFILKRTC
ncbi:MAG: hypothetical protein RLZZ316_437 [Bacteroidota bacterium]|jgi:hypothetical protein